MFFDALPARELQLLDTFILSLLDHQLGFGICPLEIFRGAHTYIATPLGDGHFIYTYERLPVESTVCATLKAEETTLAQATTLVENVVIIVNPVPRNIAIKDSCL
jgi:hypothetical protein